jgi:uncharacterized protein YjiS (DUF1127 family)
MSTIMRTTLNTRLVSAPSATQGKDVGLLARFRSAMIARRQRRALMALDDRMLSDIGISRSQAYGEADRAFFDLPERHT